jgi:integrase
LSKPINMQRATAVRLTDAAIKRYGPTTSRREISDAASPGLRLIIQAKTGAKSFALRFRRPDNTHAKLTLGSYDESGKELEGVPVMGQPLTLAAARALAASVMRQRALGVDVIEERRAAKSRQRNADADREASVFGSALIQFFADHKTRKDERPRRWREDAAQLGYRFKPNSDPAVDEPEVIRGSLADIWRNKALTEIDGHDIHAAVDAARKRNTAKGRKTFAALSVFFGWALKHRRITTNPCAGVYKPPAAPSRERTLSDSEIATFWRACDRVSVPFGAMFRIMLLCGVRLREAAGMRRDELVGGIWSLGGDRTKNGRSLTLALPELALDIINALPRIGDTYVFTTSGRSAVSGFSKAKKALDLAMAEVAGKPVQEFRLHDLRRSFVSSLAGLGVALPVIERLVNHVSESFGAVQGVYLRHKFEDEMREALARWAAHITNLASDRPSNITKLSDKKRRRK